MTTTTSTLVLTGTGKIGGRVLRGLAAKGAPARSGSRSGRPPFDWDDEDTWEPALAGITSVYIAYYPDLAVPGAAAVVENFTETAVAAGAQRLVLLSGRGETEAERSEQVVQKSGVEWTILRSSWFSQNFSESFMVDALRTGTLALPVDGVLEPFVDADDLADIAVAALTEDGHAGELYEVTGPRLMSFADAVADISGATGRDFRYATTTSEDYAALLAEEGLPADAIGLLAYLFEEVLDGRNAYLTDGVERALGRAPKDFTEYARAAAAAGVWRQ
ncbi:NAD(P)H-binding protein [Rhodococcus tibetensis]|uniref:NAD(P)H-binding protein n=1 Tax=Rhodococcus tibetensis TaxID=2965064 RepID=A0ABT1QE33_9NOCA|nr:NAD(P)H-binding protein [Rhodococcus sp. FXJ9.536]MCQ4120549.1 NAD(P)H-binding protein [Rhodococcus sp. FXJ9.536]